MNSHFQIGQRWVSETEPELGLGLLRAVTKDQLTVSFAAAQETRLYAIANAPLRRVQFHPGDRITLSDGSSLIVEDVLAKDGLLCYRAGAVDVCESELNAQTSFSTPVERLLNAQVDSSSAFELRRVALQHQHRRRQSHVRGFIGARLELIAHQLFIAAEVSQRLLPRVLLADEVGLGKTIEAALVAHRLIQTGRARRVLVLVPEPLVHQWFVELLRRFNLWFHIFDADRCEAMELADSEGNPFLDEQWVLSGIEFFMRSPDRQAQAIAAQWDLLIVDEAHHLGWAPDALSPEYRFVEALATQTPGLLLLTATPEQLGVASHFARLRLLDPDRYQDLPQFLKEAEHYRTVAAIADKLLTGRIVTVDESGALGHILGQSSQEISARLAQALTDPAARQLLIEDLLDQHGTGRVMFRNTRATISGFPDRIAHLVPLSSDGLEAVLDASALEFEADSSPARSDDAPRELVRDPRVAWLSELLRSLHPQKVLCICRRRAKVEAIAAALAQRINAKMALFHEALPLVQRDRNAAWFAEDGGAQILLASEIGSEGRNFQFAHHLVLFDLPLDPDLLEQRIGRLDRIGQKSLIHVHVPFVTGSSQEVLARWFDAGLQAFERNLRGGHQLLELFGARVRDLAQDFHETSGSSEGVLDELVQETRAARTELAATLERGRDHLLELNSFRPEPAERLVQAIRQQDQDVTLDQFILRVFDHFGIHVEELGSRTYAIGSAGVFADTFPGLPAEGFVVTCDRSRALAREDIQFLTWDHPLVTGALDLIIGSPTGSSCLGHWPDAVAHGLYLESIYLIECVAPPGLHVDRFLPPTPVRIVVDHRGGELSPPLLAALDKKQLKPEAPYPLLSQPVIRQELIPELCSAAQQLAASRMATIVLEARQTMNDHLQHEIRRLRELQRVNRNVRPQEIEALVLQQESLDRHLAEARLRLDALRLIRRGP